MRRDLPVFGVALAAVLLVSFLTGSSAAKRVNAPVGTAAVTARTLACPVVNGQPRNTVGTAAAADVGKALQPPAVEAGSTVVRTLFGTSKSKTSPVDLNPTDSLHIDDLHSEAVAYATTGTSAAYVVADELVETDEGRYRALAGGTCLPPATNWWFVGGSGKVGYTDRLFLANPARTPADVVVTAWTPKGPVSTPRIADIIVPPESKYTVGVYAFAPDIPNVAIHVHAESGAVTAALMDRHTSGVTPDGGDLVPPTAAPSRHGVIAGFPEGSGPRALVVANPGFADATVEVKVVTSQGEYTPSSVKSFVVSPGRTKFVDVTKALSGATGAVLLSSDQPVFAAGRSTASPGGRLDPDYFWDAVTPAVAGPAAVAIGREPDGGECLLLLSAPQGAASVRVTTPEGGSRTIPVPAGHSVAVDITDLVKASSGSWPFVVTPVGDQPVYGVRILHFDGAHGALNTAEPLTALPGPIPLPPVREDPRLASR
ncbi:MAG TPA: DUF5719 family protein [Mycobacteriales bacterium]|nr:DUF5719 family protein [Mycobacteriales bacterium]